VLPSWFITIMGMMIVWAIALLMIAVGHARIIDVQSQRIELLELELSRASAERQELRRHATHGHRRLDEFQEWRVDLTLASRMGWNAAARYVREYPLDLPPAYLTEGGIDISFKP
jgi:hypothetical protein